MSRHITRLMLAGFTAGTFLAVLPAGAAPFAQPPHMDRTGGVIEASARGNAGTPVAQGASGFVAGMGQRALDFLRDDKLDQTGKSSAFRKLLQDSFDLDTIGKFVMGPYWRQMSDAQKKEYLSLFREYVVKIYSARFDEYSGQAFQVRGSHPAGDRDSDTIVTSFIVPKDGGQEVEVDWRVRNTGGRFQIVDVLVENVSMSVTQRSDFASVIQQGGGNVNVLFDHMRNGEGGPSHS